VNKRLIPISNWLARLLLHLSIWLGEVADSFTYCPTCGRNRYSGEPCFGKEEK